MRAGKSRIAVFHDYFGAIGGGENVVIELAKFLDADIITTGSTVNIPSSVRVISLGETVHCPGLRQISAGFRFFFCDLSGEYDLFILSGTWAHFAAHRHHPNIWYCHILVPALYEQGIELVSPGNPLKSVLISVWKRIHSRADAWSVHQVDRIIANSRHIREKISLYYNRSADIIYPPVETGKFSCLAYENFWLSVNRIYPEKRIELQIESFRQIPEENLIIAGGYSPDDHASAYAKKLRDELPANVTMLGQVSETELIDLYARCKGFLCTSYDEPFGITPVEAMASGKAVVAVDSGGFRETVSPETGYLVQPEVRAVISAVREISTDPARFHDACIRRAKEFDTGIFREKILRITGFNHS